MKKILSLLLAFALAFAFVSCGECEHVDEDGDSFCDECDEELDGEQTVCEHVDEDGDSFCDECDEELDGEQTVCEHRDGDGDSFCDKCTLLMLTEAEWKNAYAFTNARLSIKETVRYNGSVLDSYDQTLLVHDSLVYNEAAVEQFSPLEAYVVYFAFSDCFSSFVLGTDGKYRCAEIAVDGLIYKNVVITFDDAKNLSSVSFDTNNGYYDFTISSELSDHGTIEKPERAPFVPKEGDDYCKYYTERNVEGHNLAYVTITIKGYGDVKLLLDATTAPETVKHILKLINEGFYDGLTFHRVINEFMIQGGDPSANGTGNYKDKDGNKVTIKGEFSANGHENDILHLRGVISMARGSDNNSASCQFFICNADADWLDGQYAAFGYVIDGMSVIDHVTYDTYVYGDANGTISDKTKHAVIESIVIDELVGITLDEIIEGENELPLDNAD